VSNVGGGTEATACASNLRNCYRATYTTSTSVNNSLSTPGSLFSFVRYDANTLFFTARFPVKYYATSTATTSDSWKVITYAAQSYPGFAGGVYQNLAALNNSQYAHINSLNAYTLSSSSVTFSNTTVGEVSVMGGGTLANTGNIVLKYNGIASIYACNNVDSNTGINAADGTTALGTSLVIANGYASTTLSTSDEALAAFKPFPVTTDSVDATTSTLLSYTVPASTTAYGSCSTTVTLTSSLY
jgi:hypothetical protein